MVRSVDIFIINGESFINYCSDNDFNYTIYIGQKCKVLRNEKCFIGTLYEVDSNKNTFSIKQNNGEIIEILSFVLPPFCLFNFQGTFLCLL